MAMANPIAMRLPQDQTIEPAGHLAAEMRKGQVLRIIDVEGQQVADLVTFNIWNVSEKLSIVNTVNLNKQVFPRVGYVLYSDEANAMMTVIGDTCGVHDVLAGSCSRFTNEHRYKLHRFMGRDGLDCCVFKLPANLQCLQRISPQAVEGRHL
jgi:uncharacterized protein